jgi:hypothetical protein
MVPALTRPLEWEDEEVTAARPVPQRSIRASLPDGDDIVISDRSHDLVGTRTRAV